MPKVSKVNNIQGLRGVAVLLVAFSHLFSIEEKYGGAQQMIPAFSLFGFSGVDLFFVISGFVMVAITRGKFQNPKAAFNFIVHRVIRIYPVYWVYSTLVLAVFLIRPSWVNSAQDNQVSIVSSFLLLPQALLPLINVGWTLIHEMYFYWAFFLIILVFPERLLALNLAVWSGLIILYALFFESSNSYLRLVFHPLTLEFIGGCFIGIMFYGNSLKYGNKTLLAITAISFIMLIVSYEITQIVADIYTSAWYWRILTYGVPSLFIVHCSVHLERENYLFPKWLGVIGDASYSIYLSHVLVLSVLGRVWHMVSFNGIVDNVIAIPILTALMLGFGLFNYHAIERPITNACRNNRLTRRFAGLPMAASPAPFSK